MTTDTLITEAARLTVAAHQMGLDVHVAEYEDGTLVVLLEPRPLGRFDEVVTYSAWELTEADALAEAISKAHVAREGGVS